MSELADALTHLDLHILKFDPSKQRPVSSDRGTLSMEKFSKALIEGLGRHGKDYPDVFDACHDLRQMQKLLTAYAKEKNILVAPIEVEVPKEFENLTLNLDLTHQGRDPKYFLTDPGEIVSEISGSAYVKILQMKEAEAVAAARKVMPKYMPRNKAGVNVLVSEGVEKNVFNTYIPPRWKRYPRYKSLPDKLPPLFEKLVNHLFPLKTEREYFYSWLYYSMFKRSYVYLVLCGAPGTGKNRLKLVLRALHGHMNTIDGKRSTLVERFNSQLADATLAWFDELHYDIEMENMMKELQNDSISIERKGIDATRSTEIHASLVISNNKPRDNYIAFDARKFVPLQLNSARLEKGMTPKEITELTSKVEKVDSPTFDVEFIAQIAKWIKNHGRSDKWPNLEYKGPMFYKLAHTSMSRWQKKAATLILDTKPMSSGRIVFSEKKGFLWSALHDSALKKNGDRSLQFPDFTTVKYFFDIFVDSKGQKAFKTEDVPNNIMGDFWVKKLTKDLKIMTEASVMGETPGANQNGKKEKNNSEEDYIDL